MTVTDLRRFTLGGSEAAAACGVDPFLSPVMLWAYKTGRAEHPETEAMRFGRKLERVVWEALEEDGYDLLPAPADGFRDDEREWLVGHPDGFTVLTERETPSAARKSEGSAEKMGLRDAATPSRSASAVLEIKTANQWAHRAGWNGDVPVQYQAQAQVYMHLTKRARCTVAVLVGGSRLEVRTIDRDEYATALLLEGMERFHWHLRRDKMPAPDGSDSTRDALLELFPGTEGEVKRLDREHWTIYREAKARKEQLAVVKEQYDTAENKLRAFAENAAVLISPHDDVVARYGHTHPRRIDVTKLRAELPKVAEEFTTVTTTRRFTLL